MRKEKEQNLQPGGSTEECVAIYTRISTKRDPDQLSPFELQSQYYESFIKSRKSKSRYGSVDGKDNAQAGYFYGERICQSLKMKRRKKGCGGGSTMPSM